MIGDVESIDRIVDCSDIKIGFYVYREYHSDGHIGIYDECGIYDTQEQANIIAELCTKFGEYKYITKLTVD